MTDTRQAGIFIPSQDIETIRRILDRAQGIQSAAPKAPPVELTAHKFTFGAESSAKLQVLLPKLRECVVMALTLSTIDFRVMQTIRSLAAQKQAVASGHSRTMKSKHLPDENGFAHAADLGAWVGGKVVWTEDCYADIAWAMDKAATQLGIASNVRWGAAWDRVLSDFGGAHIAYLAEAKAYAIRHTGSDLIDMPHFEWVD
jgi:peptidoglycan L-alanyl-D-glutamate endopeptidase CwlK